MEITNQDINASVARIGEDQVRLAAWRRAHEQPEHLLEILTRASIARPNLMHRKSDHRLLGHRMPTHPDLLNDRWPSGPASN